MDFDIEDEITEYEQIRERHRKELESLFSQWHDDIDESVKDINKYVAPKHPKRSIRRRKHNDDPTFSFTGVLPFERRRSDRLLSISPKYSPEDLVDDMDSENRKKHSYDVIDLEKVVFRKRPTSYRKTIGFVSMPVEDITEKYLEKIATRVTVKVYSSENGTCCHQCRQKTLDSKTYCRGPHCVGVRGQFCGVCLKNRYGEDAREALLNPKWECPPCRGLCNCSICRTRQGKRPTGILAPIAFQYGHKSVKDFLLSLNGIGDYVNEPPKKKHKDDAIKHKHRMYDESYSIDYLIGFNEDLKPMWVSRNKSLIFSDDKHYLVGFNKDEEPVMVRV